MLNVTQQELKPYLKQKKNIYITGSAGSGKTYAVSDFANTSNKNIVLTATTGIAAIQLGGETIHRFLSLGIASRPFELPKIMDKWTKIRKSTTPWDKLRCNLMDSLDAIVIDEVSMLRRDQFELIDAVLSFVRGMSIPFGGVRIILSGDFLQLPPVVSEDNLKNYMELKDPYCFQSGLWNYGCFNSFNLTNNYRQSDPVFLKALETIRTGTTTKEIDDLLLSRVGAKLETDLTPLKLFSHKYKADNENLACLKRLPADKIQSTAEYTGKEYDREVLKKECPAEDVLYYCDGAQVMMLTNDTEGRWVNGTMGVIERSLPPRVRLSSGALVDVEPHVWERKVPYMLAGDIESRTVATCMQYPFRLSWGSTIHKSQGLTLDYVEVDLGSCFSPGQAYVALSRVRTLNGLTLKSYNKKSVFANQEVRKFYGL